jgi:hypothetical protein
VKLHCTAADAQSRLQELSHAAAAGTSCLSLQDCWSGDPLSRPSMDAVVSRLEAAAASGELQGLDKPAGCACTIC